MSLIQLAITVIVIVAIVAICAWFVRSSGITIPQPLMIVIYAVVAILMILLLANLAGMGPPILR